MTKGKFYPLLLGVAVALGACSKNNEKTSVGTGNTPPPNAIAPGNVSGVVKGVFVAGASYTITGNLQVNKGDTLSAQPGAQITVKNNSLINVDGVLSLIGSKDSTIEINSDTKLPGSWGGLICDSATSVTIKWTHVDNTGGPDPTGSPTETVEMTTPGTLDIEDSWFTNGQDNGFNLKGGCKITILRNTILCSGSTDGEAIDVKNGVTGTIAYNVIYSQAGTAIKLESSSTTPIPQTQITAYNNTILCNGWRRGQAEPGRAISVDVGAMALFYNNIIEDNYQGILVTDQADTTNTKYGNNLFYASADTFLDTTGAASGLTPVTINIRSEFYPPDGIAKPQPTDIISTMVGQFDPMFVSFDGKLSTPNGAATSNNYHLQPGSPAIGKGNTTYNADIGAYTSDGKGNQH
ncbi:MAG TPA: right-handed parallel beta-helix repeat-containing protein [Dinghuibacter sp.]|uniref:right-handed parallel beta-helix repeat-containing protein n=1 Tax=Dinghuibacter sp. TaxID=2024697 RepID=UPI002C94E756|nr:right-handed parallel beta-helix repeat-containing protein [Dinghuibacter sp.]HTJ12588.1 right-handed parallel beta-helix repeat-containing protein [Dinghuibacter sp.]